jgi:protein-S-isoprenylcysteine O-methyltransferase Ste14
VTVDSVRPTDNPSRKSTILSWLAVLVLGLVLFGIIRGLVWLWGGEDTDALPAIWEYWAERWYYGSWTAYDWLSVVLILVLAAVTLFAIVRQLGHNTPQAERRAIVVGSSVLYLPSALGTLPAVIGIVHAMFTPFLGGGLVSIVAPVLQGVGLTHDMGDWIAKGVVSPSLDYDGWWSQSRFMVAQSLVAVGLAISIVGFIQVFSAYKHRHLQTQGLYSTLRHPQHVGIALWTFGLAFAVNGTAAYMTWFTVLYFYVVLAVWEESHMARQFGSAYDSYRRATPFAIPFVNIGLPLPKANVARVAGLIAYYVVGMTILCLIMQAIGVQHPDFL